METSEKLLIILVTVVLLMLCYFLLSHFKERNKLKEFRNSIQKGAYNFGCKYRGEDVRVIANNDITGRIVISYKDEILHVDIDELYPL